MTDQDNNRRQDVSIARLEEKFNAFEKRFDDFVNNHFKHLRQRVDWILWILILGTLITILTKVLAI